MKTFLKSDLQINYQKNDNEGFLKMGFKIIYIR